MIKVKQKFKKKIKNLLYQFKHGIIKVKNKGNIIFIKNNILNIITKFDEVK